MNKKQIKKAVNKNLGSAKKTAAELQKLAKKEYAVVEKEMKKAQKQVQEYIKKNPEKASLISAGIGVALGGAIAMLFKKKK